MDYYATRPSARRRQVRLIGKAVEMRLEGKKFKEIAKVLKVSMPNRNPKKFLLTGRIFCAVCSKKLYTFTKTGSGRWYYAHRKSERNGCDGIKCIRTEHIDAAVLKECFLVFGGDEKAYQEAIAEFVPDAKTRKDLETTLRSLQHQISKAEKEKDGIVNRLLNTAKLSDSIVQAANQKVEKLDARIDSLKDEHQQKQTALSSMLTPEEYEQKAEQVREQWRRVFSGFKTLEDMPLQNRQYLIDQMFDGADEQGRPFGVYVKNVKARVFEYEIYGRFTEGARWLKAEDGDYEGPETEAIQREWDQQRQTRKRSRRLEMGDTGLEPVTR